MKNLKLVQTDSNNFGRIGLKYNKRYKYKKQNQRNFSRIEIEQSYKFEFISINLASPSKIKSWSERRLPLKTFVGEVTIADTFNYRTFHTEIGGMFCEQIFGPLEDWKCQCRSYIGVRVPGKVCETCGVEITDSRVRRHRMGFIDLMHPVTHLWFLKGHPGYLSLILEFSVNFLIKVIYYEDLEVFFEDSNYFEFQADSEEEDIAALDDFVASLNSDFANYKKFYQLDFSDPLQKSGKETEKIFEEEDFFFRAANLDTGKDIGKSLLRQRFSGSLLIKELLERIDLNHEILFERHKLYKIPLFFDRLKKTQRVKELRSFKRLRILESFYFTGAHPSWMILTYIPVLPPDLRPMVELENGQLVSSDLNELYRTLLTRNNRFLNLLKIGDLPDIVITNEKRLLQQAVDSLIDNGKLVEDQLISPQTDRPLRSLAEIIEGKFGRFRHNLLGKRVDYSARSVIVSGPGLRLNQCALPFRMLIELFQCQISDLLVGLKIIKSSALANFVSQYPSKFMIHLLTHLMKDHPILLNRAPTLHRLGVQAFDVILAQDFAIHLHPLVCSAFNADFDGDQMGVHIPLSVFSKLEAIYLMQPKYNILSPADGSPIFKPSQDMVLGCYYLTLKNDFFIHFCRGQYFSSSDEVIIAFNLKKLGLQIPIWVKLKSIKIDYQHIKNNQEFFDIRQYNNFCIYYNQQLQIVFNSVSKEFLSVYIRTTPGRVLFNRLLDKSCNVF